jgi:hypothetical protein
MPDLFLGSKDDFAYRLDIFIIWQLKKLFYLKLLQSVKIIIFFLNNTKTSDLKIKK